jgi:hypothetical protein
MDDTDHALFPRFSAELVATALRSWLDEDARSAASAAEPNRMQRAGLASRVFTGFLEWCREGESNPQDPKVGGF